MKYYQAKWSESRGDKYAHWGVSTWLFEIDNDNYVVRQIEIYKNGNSLIYDENKKIEDGYGGLSEKVIEQYVINDNNFILISKEEFEARWRVCGNIDGSSQWD